MASKGGGCPASLWNMARLGLKPLTQHNLKTHYAPITGVSSYMALAVSISSPDLFLRVFRNHDITNNLLIGAVVGNAAYLYNRKHMTQVPTNIKILYSGFGAVIFSVGSVLLWAMLSNHLPDNPVTRSTAGLVSGALFLQIAKNYFDLIDGTSTSQAQSKP